MKAKGMFGMAMMMGAMLAGSHNNFRDNNYESEEDKKKRLADAKIKQNIAKGLKEFDYINGSVWALNQKSADKKAKKRNLF